MKPIILTAQQRKEIERRRKDTLDRRVYQRLTAVLTVAEGKSREEVAHLLGIGLTQLGEWLRIYRNKGLDALCVLHYKGDPGKLFRVALLGGSKSKEKSRTGRRGRKRRETPWQSKENDRKGTDRSASRAKEFLP
jgi:Helix-turn-helix domain